MRFNSGKCEGCPFSHPSHSRVSIRWGENQHFENGINDVRILNIIEKVDILSRKVKIWLIMFFTP